MNLIFEKTTSSAEETEAFGAAIAKHSIEKSIQFIALYGDLGAGKTAFTRGFASVTCKDASVCSPTYSIVNEYDGDVPLFHFDMYRIEDEDSLESIGFYDYFGRGIIITEWSENIPYALPEKYLKIVISKLNENNRKISAYIVGE